MLTVFLYHINLHNKIQETRLLVSPCSQEDFDQWERPVDPFHSALWLWQSDPHVRPNGKANLSATSSGFRRWTDFYTRILNKWKSFFYFPIYENILSAGSFKKLKRGFGTILIFQSCELTCTILLSLSMRIWPTPSGHGNAWSILLCMGKGFKGGAGPRYRCSLFWELTIPYTSKPILVIMACTSDMKHFSVTI